MTTTPTDHSELRARLEALCKAGFIEPAYTLDHDEIAVVIALLDQCGVLRERTPPSCLPDRAEK